MNLHRSTKDLLAHLFVICIVIFPCQRTSAQIDSLMNVIATDPTDLETIQLANTQMQAALYQAPADILASLGLLDSLLANTEDIYSKAETKNSLGLSLYVNQRFDDAIAELLESIKMFEQINRKDKIARLSNSLAIVYQVRKEAVTSASYWEKALSIYEELNDTLWIANVASNLGGHYMEHDQPEKADKMFDRAIPLFEVIGRPDMLGYAKLNQGSLRVKQGRYREAISSFDKTFELIPYSANPLIHAVAHTGRGNGHLELKQWANAKKDLEKGYKISVEIGQYEQQVPATELLSRYYEETGDYEQSLAYYKERAMLQDSFLTAEEDARLVDALQKYETEKKEQEITLLSAENEIKDLRIQTERRNLALALMGILGLAAFVIYFYRSRQRTLALNNQLKEQKGLISKSLREKEYLLKEIHHRVKNNLQVISSLLKLQSRSVEDQKAQQALDEGRSRVRSMALIHQNLYQDDSQPGEIKIKEYISQLTEELFETYKVDTDRIDLSVDIEDVTLDVDTVVPMGLIINELLTNSLKYAFPDGQKGSITISLNVEDEDVLQLNYKDNGIGYDASALSPKSFGLRLVRSFAERLNATYELDGDKGASASLLIRDYKIAA